MNSDYILGIDLAGKEKNPTGIALWLGKRVETSIIYTDKEIMQLITENKPKNVAIDAPLKLPKRGLFRKADKEMVKRGFRVFPPGLPSMRTLTLRAIKLNKLIAKEGIKIMEVHPTSTRKALSMPVKNWVEIQKILNAIGIEGSPKTRTLTSHEIDAITAALTAYLHERSLTEALGDEKEGYIIIPKRQDWRNIIL